MKIAEWIEKECGTKGFSDIHIDSFNPEWKPKKEWVAQSAKLLIEASSLIEQKACNVKLALAFTVVEKVPGAAVVERLLSLENALDHSPPSLFVAAPGSEPWMTSISDPRVSVASLSPGASSRLLPVPRCSGMVMDYENEPDMLIKTIWFFPENQTFPLP